MTAPFLAARMPWPTRHLGVLFHHRAERLDPGRQAEPIERRRHFSHALPTGALGIAVVIMVDLFMALLSFVDLTLSLPAQGEQRRSFYFNIDRDISCY
jgi:hypothetical protein